MVPPPRSVADATRFTPTGPHAFTRTPLSAAATATVGETPQQRVARLREAARRAKSNQISTVDKIIDRGRVWADKAHRVAAFSLIGATVLCGGFTIFASIDMVLYARRKKRAYLEEQKALKTADPAGASNESGAPVAATTPPTSTSTTPSGESNTVTDKLKTWALSGLTPAEKEEELRRQSVESRVIVKDDILSQPGADNLAKGEKEKGGSTGVLGSITGWWSGR
ncbi:cytochrome oxidase c assembly-domain-containing protein [Tuber indicum]|nr:cytochrome oxidase c assembly-domain-containing protein [Tuber indicum]